VRTHALDACTPADEQRGVGREADGFELRPAAGKKQVSTREAPRGLERQ